MDTNDSIDTWARARRDVQASPDFADRVMARVHKIEAARPAARKTAARARLYGHLSHAAEAAALLAAATFYGSRLVMVLFQVAGR
jgi:hypothetical protein